MCPECVLNGVTLGTGWMHIDVRKTRTGSRRDCALSTTRKGIDGRAGIAYRIFARNSQKATTVDEQASSPSLYHNSFASWAPQLCMTLYHTTSLPPQNLGSYLRKNQLHSGHDVNAAFHAALGASLKYVSSATYLLVRSQLTVSVECGISRDDCMQGCKTDWGRNFCLPGFHRAVPCGMLLGYGVKVTLPPLIILLPLQWRQLASRFPIFFVFQKYTPVHYKDFDGSCITPGSLPFLAANLANERRGCRARPREQQQDDVSHGRQKLNSTH